MANPRSDFRLVADRTRSGRSFWRVYFHDANGLLRKVSTGIEDTGKASEVEAGILAVKIVEAVRKKASEAPPLSFGSFAGNFWDWETSEYLRALLARDAQAVSPEHAYTQHRGILKHLRPWVVRDGQHKGRRLWSLPAKHVSADILDQLVTDLLEGGLSTGTVKHLISSLSPIFLQLQKRGLIVFSPIKLMMPIPLRRKTRDAFALAEARKLLDPKRVAHLWRDESCRSKAYRDGWRWYTMAVLCLVTGARWGAVAALTREDLHLRHLEDDGLLERYYVVDMTRTYAAMRGVKEGSKTGAGVQVPVDAGIMEMLLPHLPESGPLFPSFGVHGIVTHHTARDHLREAMLRIGITPAAASARLLGFHSFRHTFVTAARAAGVSKDIRRAFTEHKSDEVEAGYDHLKLAPKDLLVVAPVQRTLLAV